MADRTRRIRLQVQDEFSRPLHQFVTQMEQAGQATAKVGTSGKGMATSFKDAIRGATDLAYAGRILYNAFAQPFKIADQFADMGREAMKAEIALRGLAGSGTRAAEWTNAIKTGLMGTVTEAEAARQAYQLMRLELAKTPEEAQKFARMIGIIAQANPMLGDTSEAISQIALTISNMSYMRLDQLGISAGKVRGRVQELKDSIAGLSTEEAFKMAVFEELNTQAEMIGDEILAVDSATKRLSASLSEIKTDVGHEIAEGFEAGASIIESTVAMFDWLINAPPIQIAEKLPIDPGWLATFQMVVKGTGMIINEDILGNEPEDTRRPSEKWRYDPKTGIGEYDKRSASQRYADQVNMWRRTSDMQWNRHIMKSDLDFQADYYRRNNELLMEFYAEQDRVNKQQQAKKAYYQARPDMLFREGQWAAQEVGSAVFDFMSGKTGVNMQAVEGVASLAANIGQATQNLLGLGAAAINAGRQFDSLEEKFGLAASAFDQDVYKEMRSALDEAGVGAEQAEAAIEAYELKTGMANAQSELFASSLAMVTELFDSGQMTAEEYSNAVLALGQMDLSNIDAMMAGLQQGDFTQFQSVLETLKTFDPGQLQAVANLPYAFSDAAGRLRAGIFGRGAGAAAAPAGEAPLEEVSPTDAMISDIDTLETRLSMIETDWPAYFTGAFNLATGEFDTFTSDATTQIDSMDAHVAEKALSMQASLAGFTGGGGGGGATESLVFHGGGEGGGGEGGGSLPVFDNIKTGITDLDTTMTESTAAWSDSVTTSMGIASGEFDSFSNRAYEDIGKVREAMAALENRYFSLTLTTSVRTEGSGAVAAQAGAMQGASKHALGGHVPGGRLVELDERGVPETFTTQAGQTYLVAPAGGGRITPLHQSAAGAGGGGTTVIKLLLDGKEVYQATAREGKRRNAPVSRGM